ncbi:MAG: DUF4403 family protein [Gammaproteobacteria bacterium]|nr:DUF4403 family protein [Gammaproteobacteria bacterium]MDH5800703.1 DUF4403 family protein [Gammaproteobacteria bacterium]
MKKIFILLLLLCIPVFLGLFYGLQLDQALTQAPPRQADRHDLKPVTSFVSIPYSIDLLELQQKLDESIANPIDTINKECKLIKSKYVKANAQCIGEITKRGPITVVGHENGITASLPIAFRLTARTRGRIKMQETATGAMTVNATITPGMLENWEPNTTLSANFHWDKKPQIKVFGMSITFAGLLEPKLRENLNKAVERFNQRLKEKLALRDKAQKTWDKLSTAKNIRKDPEVWLTTQLEKVYFEPFKINSTTLSGSIGMKAKILTVFGEPPPISTAALPKLNLSRYADGFALRVPLVLKFDALRDFLKEKVAGKTVPLTGKDGELTLYIKDVDIYPSGDNIAMAVFFKAAAQNQLLSTSGSFHITGKPVFEETTVKGKPKVTIGLVNVQFGRQVDSTVLDVGTWVLQDTVREYLAKSFIIDVTDKFLNVRRKAEAQLNQRMDKGQIKGQLNKATLENILIYEKWLMINTVVSGKFGVELDV